MSKDELGQVVNLHCTASSADRATCEFKHLPEFFAQVAFYAFRGEHPVIAITNLINYMRNRALDQGKSTEAYDEPDYGNGDKDLCRQLTAQLQDDPHVDLPDGYKKV
jgi:hypothetical protein